MLPKSYISQWLIFLSHSPLTIKQPKIYPLTKLTENKLQLQLTSAKYGSNIWKDFFWQCVFRPQGGVIGVSVPFFLPKASSSTLVQTNLTLRVAHYMLSDGSLYLLEQLWYLKHFETCFQWKGALSNKLQSVPCPLTYMFLQRPFFSFTF